MKLIDVLLTAFPDAEYIYELDDCAHVGIGLGGVHLEREGDLYQARLTPRGSESSYAETHYTARGALYKLLRAHTTCLDEQRKIAQSASERLHT